MRGMRAGFEERDNSLGEELVDQRAAVEKGR